MMPFAFAAHAEDPEATPGPRLALHAVVEAWDDAAIGSVYRTGTLLAGIAAEVPIAGPVAVDLEAAYKGMDARDAPELGRFQILPVSVLAVLNVPAGRGFSGFVGLGPDLVVFSERHPAVDGIGVTNGVRGAAELRAGARVDLGLVSPPMERSAGVGIQAVELVVYAGRRSTLPRDEGFRLGAWRGALGVGVRF